MNTKAKGIRVEESVIEQVEQRAKRRGWNFNKWVNWAIQQGLRPHRSK